MATLTSAQRDHLTSLFIVMFDAAPGVKILSQLVGAREAGSSLADIAAILGNTPQFKQLFPALMAADEAADRIVATLLPESTPAAAKTWAKGWVVEKLTSGESLASVLLQAGIALTQTTNANYAAAKAQLANKLKVANYYTITLQEDADNLADLQKVLANVTDDPETADEAIENLDPEQSENPNDPNNPNDPQNPGDPSSPPPVGGTSETISEKVTVGITTTIKTKADKVTLTLTAKHSDDSEDGNAQYANVLLDSDAKQLTITLNAITDDAGTDTKADDVLDKVSLTINANGTDYADLVTVKLSGNGKADIVNSDGASLVYIDASGLSSKTIDNKLDEGLTYTSTNSLAETIILGSGKDALVLENSTVSKTDVVRNLTLVDDSETAGTQLDLAASDSIKVGLTGFVKANFNSSSSLDFALIAASKSNLGDHLVFQYGGNTYIYADTGSAQDSLDDQDFLVKLVGTVNLDLLLEALNG